MQPRFDRSLASAWLVCTGVAIAVMLWPSCTQIASTAAADDPFAVLAAKPVQVRPQSEREVRIVRPDGTPAADALVVLVRGQRGADLGPDWRAAAMRWPSDEPRQYAAMARDGERLAVDERGCVRTPHHGFVYAFAGDCVGRLFVEDTVATVQLVATHPCTVEVVDAQGQPTARVPIAVRTTGLGLLLSQHTTGADGTRTLRLLVSRPDECRIGLYIGTNAPIDAPLPPRGGHVRLAMPPTTAVTATYVGDLTPRRALSFRLQCKSPEQAIPGEPVGERSAVWPFVAIGTEVTATVDLRAPEPLGTVASARAATTVTANAPPLELGATFTSASVVLQVLDLAGQPTPHRAFTLRIQQGDARRLRHIRADPEGWVELSLPGGFDDVQPVTFELDLHADAPETEHAFVAGELLPTARRSPGPKVGRAQLKLHLREPVRQRLDPIRCQPMPVLAAGQLVLPDGTAPGAHITLTTDEGLRLRTDEAGRFELRGEAYDADREFERPWPPEDEATRRKMHGSRSTTTDVEIERTWCFPGDSARQAQLPHGATDLRLVVQRCVAVPLHPELAMHDLTTLEFSVVAKRGNGRFDVHQLEWSGRTLLLPVGSWDLVVRAGNHELGHPVLGEGNDELMRWRNVRTDGAGGGGLAAIDWRPFARLIEVRIVDRHGQPVDGEVRLPDLPTNAPKQGSVVRVLVPHGGTDLEVHCRGRAFQKTFRQVQQDLTAVIEAEPQLRVRLQPAPTLPAGIQLELVLADDASAVFDEQAEAVVAFPGAGTFPATIRLRKGSTSSAPLDWQLPRLDVPKDGARIPIQITPERRRVLEAAVAELRDR
jgi:hypothetical protein